MEDKTQYVSALLSIFAWIGAGTILFHYLEPWNWTQAFYFSVVSLSTVGYGDLVPSNDLTRLFTAFYLLIGVAIVVAALGIIGRHYLENKKIKIKRIKK